MDRELVEQQTTKRSTDFTQSGRRSLVASLRTRFLAKCSSLFTSTMWMLGLNKRISKFADDTKTVNSVLTDKDRQSLQEDLHKISAWSDKWEMPINVDKCQGHQVGTRNKKFDYEMRCVKLKSLHCDKDLGVKIASNLKFSQ